MATWEAPRAAGPVRGTVVLPGSKSLTNRLLVLAALAEGPSRLRNPLRARDTELMAGALRALGVGIEDDGADWLVTPGVLTGGDVNVGLAGTVMRFVPPLAALARGDTTFDGDVYARERPIATLLDGLRQAGARIDDGGRGRMPFTVHGQGGLTGGPVRIDASGSSQFVSGLLLAAPRFDKGIEITHSGPKAIPSRPHIEMTLELLRKVGAEVSQSEPGCWQVAPGSIVAGEHDIEPDLSNAAPFLAAAVATGGEVTVPDWPLQTTQAGDAVRGLLAAMGADVRLDDTGLTVRGTGAISGLDADLRDVSELVTVVAALAALADRPSRLSGLGHMRGHETDRLAALYRELTGLGCAVVEHADELTIDPRFMHGGTWRCYADHRMATAGAVLGLRVDGVVLDDIACTTKTLPDFPGMWSALLGG